MDRKSNPILSNPPENQSNPIQSFFGFPTRNCYASGGLPVAARQQAKKIIDTTTLYMQHKMTNSMTMQEQIELSGLEIMSSLSSSSSSSQLQWNSTNQWSPLLGGGQEYQACVTIESCNENGAGGQTIVVIGGLMHRVGCTNSVILWDLSTKRWRNGPSLNDRSCDLVAVFCCDKVYAIGGLGGDNYNNYTTLDTIESIQVS